MAKQYELNDDSVIVVIGSGAGGASESTKVKPFQKVGKELAVTRSGDHNRQTLKLQSVAIEKSWQQGPIVPESDDYLAVLAVGVGQVLVAENPQVHSWPGSPSGQKAQLRAKGT